MTLRNVDQVEFKPVEMEGAERVRMAMMIGRADGAPNFSMRQFRVEPGGHTPRHSHDYEHEVLILAGAGAALHDGKERRIKAGDALFVPANSEHQFRADQGEELRFICLVPASQNCGEPTPGS